MQVNGQGDEILHPLCQRAHFGHHLGLLGVERTQKLQQLHGVLHGAERALQVVAHHALHIGTHVFGLLAFGNVAQHPKVAAEAVGRIAHGADAGRHPLALAARVQNAQLAVHLALVGQGFVPRGVKGLPILAHDAVDPAQAGQALQGAAGLALQPLVGEDQPAAHIRLEHAHRGLTDKPGQPPFALAQGHLGHALGGDVAPHGHHAQTVALRVHHGGLDHVDPVLLAGRLHPLREAHGLAGLAGQGACGKLDAQFLAAVDLVQPKAEKRLARAAHVRAEGMVQFAQHIVLVGDVDAVLGGLEHGAQEAFVLEKRGLGVAALGNVAADRHLAQALAHDVEHRGLVHAEVTRAAGRVLGQLVGQGGEATGQAAAGRAGAAGLVEELAALVIQNLVAGQARHAAEGRVDLTVHPVGILEGDAVSGRIQDGAQQPFVAAQGAFGLLALGDVVADEKQAGAAAGQEDGRSVQLHVAQLAGLELVAAGETRRATGIQAVEKLPDAFVGQQADLGGGDGRHLARMVAVELTGGGVGPDDARGLRVDKKHHRATGLEGRAEDAAVRQLIGQLPRRAVLLVRAHRFSQRRTNYVYPAFKIL